MSKTVTESIFDGPSMVIPLADVQHVERHWYTVAVPERTKFNFDGILVITKHTTWDKEIDAWANNIYLGAEEGKLFLSAWTRYRSELECDTLIETP